MDGERKPRNTRNLQVSYRETGRSSKPVKTVTKTLYAGTLANTSPSDKEIIKSSSKSVKPPAEAGKRISIQVNPSTAAVKRLSTTSQESRLIQANPPAVAGKRVLNQVNPPAVNSKRLSTTTQESRLTAIEAAHNHLKAENVALHQTIAQLKSDLESVQIVLVEFCDSESKLKEYQETNKLLSDENSVLKRTISALRSETNTLQQEVIQFRSEIKQVYNQHQPAAVKVLHPQNSHKLKSASTIQVQLKSVDAKREFLQIRRVKKDILPTDIGFKQSSNKPILITEQLTKSNQQLLYAARSLRGENKFKYVWSNNGQIFLI